MAALDHPSYLTRQTLDVAVAANTALTYTFPFDIRVRSALVTVRTAGTAGGKVTLIGLGTSVQYPNVANFAIGTATGQAGSITSVTTNTTTTTLGTATTGAAAAGVYQNMGDLNVKIPAGQQLQFSATDIQIAYNASVEYYIDPQFSAWTGSN